MHEYSVDLTFHALNVTACEGMLRKSDCMHRHWMRLKIG
jgi:hypothetical protein